MEKDFKPDIIIVDANNTSHKAAAKLNLSVNVNGKIIPTSIAFGLLRHLMSLYRIYEPKNGFRICWDSDPTIKKDMNNSYKANRGSHKKDFNDELIFTRNMLKQLYIPQYKQEGWEADDLIGTLARKYSNLGKRVLVVSTDKDMYQLLAFRNTLIRKDKISKLYSSEDFKHEYKFKPFLYRHYLALTGCSTDNVMGVKRVGPVIASELIRKFGKIHEIYKDVYKIDSKTLRSRLLEDKHIAFRNLKLIKIYTDLKFHLLFNLKVWNEEDIRIWLEKYNFKETLKPLNIKILRQCVIKSHKMFTIPTTRGEK